VPLLGRHCAALWSEERGAAWALRGRARTDQMRPARRAFYNTEESDGVYAF
jgi:hypothetical protein